MPFISSPKMKSNIQQTIGYLGFIVGIPLIINIINIINKPRAAEVPVCPNNVRDKGTAFKFEKDGEFIFTTTFKEFYYGNKENYPARLGLAKLKAVEEFIKFADVKLTKEAEAERAAELKLLEANLPESLKFGKGLDFSWNRIKRSLASMKVLDACITKNKQIVFTAIWDSRDIKKLNNQIAVDDAFIDFFFYFEDKEKELKQINKIYPDLYSTEDPNFVIDIIEKYKGR